MKTRKVPTQGCKSPRFGHLGLWTRSLGPHSSVPGERLTLLILNEEGNIVRRLEQIRGNCIDEGYVDFFLSHNCRPAAHEYPLVDIDEKGDIAAVLHPDFRPGMSMDAYLEILTSWVSKWGKPEYAL